MSLLIQHVRILLTFYKSYVWTSMSITAACATLIFAYGIGILSILFWFKVATLGIIFYFVNDFKSDEYYYYSNLGYSKVMLWTSTFIFDFVAFVLLLSLTSHFR